MAFLFTFQILQKPLRHRPLLPHRRQVEGLPLGCLFKSLQQQATATTIIITTTIIVNTNLSVRPETVAMKHFCQMMIRPHQPWKGRLLKSFIPQSPMGKFNVAVTDFWNSLFSFNIIHCFNIHSVEIILSETIPSVIILFKPAKYIRKIYVSL